MEKITDVNEASIKVTGVGVNQLVQIQLFTDPVKAQKGYRSLKIFCC
jgi:hypothetical protein